MEKYEKYSKEIIAGIVSVFIALAFFILSNDSNLSIALGILLAGYSVQAALIKSNVQEALESNLELYNLQTSIKDPIFKNRAQKLTEQCIRDLKSLASETYEVYGPEPAFLELMGFYERAQNNDLIKSVVVYDKEMILDGIYLEHHKEAIERGAVIIKTFIVDLEMTSPDFVAKTEALYNKLKSFKEAGVKTSVVQLKSIGPDSRLNADFFLYKNIVGISSQGNNGMLSSIKITAQHQEFDDYTHRFEELSKISHPFGEIKESNYVTIRPFDK